MYNTFIYVCIYLFINVRIYIYIDACNILMKTHLWLLIYFEGELMKYNEINNENEINSIII